LNDDGLADAGAAEQSDLTAFDVGLEQVDNLDARFEKHRFGLQLGQLRTGAVDWPFFRLRDRRTLIDNFAQYVEDAPERLLTDGNGNRLLGIGDLHPSGQSVGRAHGNRAYPVAAQHLLDFDYHAQLVSSRVFVLNL